MECGKHDPDRLSLLHGKPDLEAEWCRVHFAEVIAMLLERLTAWTLVVVYYTVACGAILLGLKGAL